eukprot:5856467-Pyramimonas_sp.AAC.1
MKRLGASFKHRTAPRCNAGLRAAVLSGADMDAKDNDGEKPYHVGTPKMRALLKKLAQSTSDDAPFMDGYCTIA